MAKAVIFDLDGVLVDSLDAHYKAWTEFWRRRGKKHTRTMFDAIVATSSEETLRIRNRTFHTRVPIAQGVKEREALFYEYLSDVRLYAGAIPLLRRLHRRYALGLATSTGTKLTRYLFRRYGMGRLFDAVVTKNDVAHSKPNPAIYLLAAKRLKVRPRDCVVIEDAPNGIIAAKRAGMKVIAVMQTFGRKKLRGADVIVPSIRSRNLLRALKN